MEINQLRYFVEVAKSKNFTRAAENCHVAQPALSQQIRRLETLLGLKLLNRLPRGAALTPEGELFLPYAQRLLHDLSEAENVAAELRGAERGIVRIVTLPSACVYVLPSKLAAFRRDHARVDIVLEEYITADIAELVLSSRFDLGVTQSEPPHPGLSRALLHEEQLLLAVPEGHPLALRQEVALAQTAGEPFVMTKPNTEYRVLAEEMCRQAGFKMQAAFEADHFDSLQAYCAVGMGLAIIPESTILTTLMPPPHYLRLKPRASRRLWLVWPRQGLKNKAAETMVPYLVHRGNSDV